MQNFQQQAEQSKITIETNHPEKNAQINADHDMICQVLTNLLTNALRYGGKSLIDVRVYSHEGQARVEVQDRGIGISEENQKRIFQQFERVSAKTVVAGLGLGLFISEQIVAAHGPAAFIDMPLAFLFQLSFQEWLQEFFLALRI